MSHVWLPDGRSTLDLLGHWFTRLTGLHYQDSPLLPDPMRRQRLDSAAQEVYGIGDRGAVLVRPDGLVAWQRVGS